MRSAILGLLAVGLMAVCLTTPLFPQTAPSDAQSNDKDRTTARETEESSSKDNRIDLSAPSDDAKKHPQSGVAVMDAEDAGGVQEFQAWDPHKAAKDIEIGDFYFKRKNYRAAMDRYKEALTYKPNDAISNFRLGECEEKIGAPEQAITYYQAYLKILPHGPLGPDAQKSIDRLKSAASPETTSK